MSDDGYHCDLCGPKKLADRPAIIAVVLVTMACLLGAILALAGCATQRDFSREVAARRGIDDEMIRTVESLTKLVGQLVESDIELRGQVKALARERDALGRFMKIDQNNKAIKDAAALYPESRRPSLCELMPGNEVCKP